MRSKFLSIFPETKPVLGMLHLKGENQAGALKRAYQETEDMIKNGVSAVIVENYYGTPEYVKAVLRDFDQNNVDFIYGVNLLDDDENNFRLAAKYHASFLQLDSVAGHLTPEEDVIFAKKLEEWRNAFDGAVIGGVRFKYQPYKSGRSLEEDLRLGMERCDAIAVTGEGTGMMTDVEKIKSFRNLTGDFPLVVAAGVTPESCREQLIYADASIVGSYFKDSYKSDGDVDPEHVRKLMEAVKSCR